MSDPSSFSSVSSFLWLIKYFGYNMGSQNRNNTFVISYFVPKICAFLIHKLIKL